MKKETQRGMKKWAPCKALENQDKFIQKVIEIDNTIERPTLSEEQINEINYSLNNYLNKQIKVKYFKNKIMSIEGLYQKLNLYDQYILIDRNKILLSSIIEIKLIEDC